MTVQAGDVMKYRYAVAVFFDKDSRDILKSGVLAHTGKALNLSGGTDGYPVNMEIGDNGLMGPVSSQPNQRQRGTVYVGAKGFDRRPADQSRGAG